MTATRDPRGDDHRRRAAGADRRRPRPGRTSSPWSGFGPSPIAPSRRARVSRRCGPQLGGPLPEAGEDPVAVIEALAAGAEPGLIAQAGPRFFGFVIGGSLPAALAADWLTSRLGPERRAVRHRRRRPPWPRRSPAAGWWSCSGCPRARSVGFTTGRDDGELHGARRGASRRPRARGLGRRGATGSSARRRSRGRRRRGARHDPRGAPDARARPRAR